MQGVRGQLCRGGSPLDPESTSNLKLKSLKKLGEDGVQTDKTKYAKVALTGKGTSEGTTTGCAPVEGDGHQKRTVFPASNVNDCETKSELDNVYGCMHSPPDGIARAIKVTIDGEHPPISHSRGLLR